MRLDIFFRCKYLLSTIRSFFSNKPATFFFLASHPCFVSNGFCTHLCLLKPTGYQCACPDEDDVQPCSTLPVPPTTPSTTTETTTAIDYCKDPNLCKNGAKCLIDNDQLTGFLCECKGYFRGLACEIPIGRLLKGY